MSCLAPILEEEFAEEHAIKLKASGNVLKSLLSDEEVIAVWDQCFRDEMWRSSTELVRVWESEGWHDRLVNTDWAI